METPLKKLRLRRGLTATEVAAAVGIDQAQYTRIENGAGTTPKTAEKIVEFFGKRWINEMRVLYPERFKRNGRASAAAGL
jgi:transcriptional regulator with XRE-family HTH domain